MQRQLPRMSVQEIHFDAHRFTKVFSTGLFSLGLVAGIVCAAQVLYVLKLWLDGDAVWSHHSKKVLSANKS